uniref:Uncharacterized protein n=2 Tax=Drosophila melanogaster TaxID=7227 RepID=Q9VA24_DROME|nr:uncharacterized protein Dmel_CG15550 [Drosophila melanogaster]AAF57101.1 uncharacterized protein Dmel_CG15550 [Drosophila melanogaster]|eukprot:NP_651835.1 uncharacterized protein Dmel_CG15550 [Drosophila melanogaster]
MTYKIAVKWFPISLVQEVLAAQQPAISESWSFSLESIPTKVLIISSVVLITCIWIGCAYFMANRHQKAVQYLQSQLDELWLLQAKPSVWPHAPFIPNAREQNPPEYIPPMDPQEQEQEANEARERAEKARAFLETRNKHKDKE